MRVLTFFICLLFCACSTASVITDQTQTPQADPISELTKSMTKTEGYLNFYWDEPKDLWTVKTKKGKEQRGF